MGDSKRKCTQRLRVLMLPQLRSVPILRTSFVPIPVQLVVISMWRLWELLSEDLECDSKASLGQTGVGASINLLHLTFACSVLGESLQVPFLKAARFILSI